MKWQTKKQPFRQPRGPSIAGTKLFNKENVRNFYGFYEDGLSAYDFLPSRIVNVDEAALAVVQKSSHSKVDVRPML
jgi:hypothetical protein